LAEGHVRLCTVGLTGGLASGKSTVAERLAAMGAAVLDADAVVHELYRAQGAGAREVRRLFGDGVAAADGSIDRTALADMVGGDPEALARLNAAVHPLVFERINHWLADLGTSAAAPSAAVIEATLMVETGSYRRYDVLAVAWCRAEQQLERSVGRGMPLERARELIAAQLPLDDKRRLADVVVDNSGDLSMLDAEVARGWSRIVEICAERCAGHDGDPVQCG
jgi:dephospho-CoA kinase